MVLMKSFVYLAAVCFFTKLQICYGAPDSDSLGPFVVQIKGPDVEGSSLIIKERSTRSGHNVSIEGDQFMVDGQPLHIVSGSLHYFRVPAAYWRDRLRKLKAAGLNSVATYVEWSFHEAEERQYNFEGDRDIVKFVQLAAEEGLHVLLRPGPYICAERDLGGFPYWILGKYPGIRLRSLDENFMLESRIWLDKLFEKVKPLLFGNGGPIILVQVENEYGSYGSDVAYKEAMKDLFVKHVGTDALLYTTDGPSTGYFVAGAIAGTLTTIDFGPSEASAVNIFKPLRRYMPSGPLMNSEYYPGWLTHWGERIASTSSDAVVRTLKDMLEHKMNVNFYVFYGGTNFEFTSGANYEGTYQPDITSYDYDAPLSEAGDPTPKYYAIREALQSLNFIDPSMELPQPSAKGKYGRVTVLPKLDLLSAEGRAALGRKYDDVTGATLPTFESLRQRAGLVLYETVISATKDENKDYAYQDTGLLQIMKPRDLVFVFLDGVYMGHISRMTKLYSLPLMLSKQESVLSLLVENQGRINFRSQMHDYKGILGSVLFNKKVLDGTWKITGFPLENVDVDVSSQHLTQPTLYEGQFHIPEGETPLDTFLDTTGWGKGLVWINGHNVGRYWPGAGPQVTLYVPAVWLKPAPEFNRLQILELNHNPVHTDTMEFINYPILNGTGNIRNALV